MSQTDLGGAAAPNTSDSAQKFYATAWRWHFYAALYVIPFFLMLATTGLIMLWVSATTELNGERGRVPVTGAPLPISTLQTAAESAHPGTVAGQYVEPMGSDRVALFRVDNADGDGTAVVINPFTAEVIDTFAWSGGWYAFASDVHGTLLLGTVGDRLIEIAASLGIVLVATGVYLHWPRNRTGWRDRLVPDFSARGRGVWKSLHGVVGFWMSVVMLAFLVSGLSWSGIWGERIVQAWSTFPAEKWDNVPLSDATHAAMNHGAEKEVPWPLEMTPLPRSGSTAGANGLQGQAVTIDTVANYARTLGFEGRFQISLPADDTGVWTISHDSMSNDGHDPTADRTLHIDQYTGKILADVGYADYSLYAKGMAVGVALHEGDMGVWNMALNTLFCLAMIFLPLSGLIMWWTRRPKGAGRIAAPPRPRDMPVWKGAAGVAILIGLLFPMAGFAMLAVVLLDTLVLRFFPVLRQALN